MMHLRKKSNVLVASGYSLQSQGFHFLGVYNIDTVPP